METRPSFRLKVQHQFTRALTHLFHLQARSRVPVAKTHIVRRLDFADAVAYRLGQQRLTGAHQNPLKYSVVVVVLAIRKAQSFAAAAVKRLWRESLCGWRLSFFYSTDRLVHSTLGLDPDEWFVECTGCFARSTVLIDTRLAIRALVQSPKQALRALSLFHFPSY